MHCAGPLAGELSQQAAAYEPAAAAVNSPQAAETAGPSTR